MQNMIARYHELGTPVAKDVTVLGRDARRHVHRWRRRSFPGVWIDPSSPWVVAKAGGAHSEQRVAIAKRLGARSARAGQDTVEGRRELRGRRSRA